jgi:hypothetical protein
MALFGSKKKEAPEKGELPPLKFPELPAEEVPTYEKQAEINPSEANVIKQAVQPAAQPAPVEAIAPVETPPMETMPPVEPAPALVQAEPTATAQGVAPGQKPLFIKIERYKEVMESLEELKKKLRDAGDVLKELSKIKDEEEHELEAWHEDLEALKARIVSIDKILFEL